jgi:hypothetical protein
MQERTLTSQSDYCSFLDEICTANGFLILFLIIFLIVIFDFLTISFLYFKSTGPNIFVITSLTAEIITVVVLGVNEFELTI